MNNSIMDFSEIVVFIILFLGVFLILVGITRWIFGIGKILKELKANRRFLSYLAEKHGMETDEVEKVNGIADGTMVEVHN
jgi:hypothetical protein